MVDPTKLTTDDLVLGPTVRISTRASRVFVRAVALAAIFFLLWASFAKIDRVTRGSGRIVAQEKNSLVQHFEGGIVTQVLVQEGQSIAKGAPLIRIENSFADAELSAARLDLAAAKLRRHRLEAEAAGAMEVTFDATSSEQEQGLIQQEMRVFNMRRANQDEELKILDEQVDQKKSALQERVTRLANKDREYDLMAERVTSLRSLAAEGAVPRNELLQNEAALQKLQTERADLKFQIEQTRSALEEVEGRRRSGDLEYRSKAEEELTDVRAQIARMEEQIAAMADRRRRFDVVAPTTGKINKLMMTTVGGVVRPGQTIAEIVPENAAIEIEARLSPKDRAQVWPGLESVVRVSAYDFTTYGTLKGEVVEVSPDALQDEAGNIYFRVVIEASDSNLGENNPVVPGMQAEVDIITGQQSILDALLRPVRTVSAKALRE